ncbi:MAG: hypothetical protein ACI89L_001304 [Phycisphaerales bacterium]|jgi:hypothetical protein
MEEDPIYRGAFKLSLLGGGALALVLLAALALTGIATPFSEGWGGSQVSRAAAGYGVLRLVLGYGVLWVILKTMQTTGGGLGGTTLTRTAMAIAFTIIMLATFLPGWLNASTAAPAPPPPAGSGASANQMFGFNLIAVTVPHTVGILIAGWVHGD